MVIFENYADLIADIEATKDQLKLVEYELEYWSFDGEGSHLFGANASVIQIEKKIRSKNKLINRLEYLERAKKRIDMLLKQLDGLDYKIGYLRIVENMTHQEIADELGYSHQYIKERWSKAKEPTFNLQTYGF